MKIGDHCVKIMGNIDILAGIPVKSISDSESVKVFFPGFPSDVFRSAGFVKGIEVVPLHRINLVLESSTNPTVFGIIRIVMLEDKEKEIQKEREFDLNALWPGCMHMQTLL
jgi:hypothetical protein